MRFCYRLVASIIALFIPLTFCFTQVPPKREFRGAWIASVVNLDWPSSGARGTNPDPQRAELVSILEGLKAAGINAVVFQIRPECDALYPSTIEPWSYWLTGQQGTPPGSPFDPLQFAIQEAHKRGMELHAWFNPYRAERQLGNYPLSQNHIVSKRPDLTRDYPIYSGTMPNRKLTGYLRILNPGLPDVRSYVTSVIMDVVRHYEIDGVHFDDYFYPYPMTDSLNQAVPFQDSDTYVQYNPKGLSLGDWRRDNVNQLIKMISDSIREVNPRIKFGISPFGIWKSGVPSGITGLSAYDDIFCDATSWLQSKTVDYITPQLYWTFGGGQDYAKLAPWWSDQAKNNGRHFYPGLAAYRIAKDSPPNDSYPKSDWPASDVLNQVRLNRAVAHGNVFFRARFGVIDNLKGFTDSLKNDLYKFRALKPLMTWKEATPPNAPSGLTLARTNTTAILTWTAPTVASDGELASYYVVYRSTTSPIDISDPRNIVSIKNTASYVETNLPPPGLSYYYGVTALDQLQNESSLSNVVLVGVEERPPVVASFQLNQNYPNPFNPRTIISFRIPTEERVTLRVYDILGREVRVLVDGVLGAGEHRYQFDGTGLATGVYIYRLIAGSYVESRKMQLVR